MALLSLNSGTLPNIGPERFDALLNAFEGRKILVVGDLMLDEYVWGHTSRVSPEAPVLVLDVQQTTYGLGGAANVARNVGRMGAEVILAGVIGADSGADRLQASLRENGCSTEGVVVDQDRPTTVKTRIVVQNQQIVRIDRESREPVCGKTLERLSALVGAAIPSVDGVILSDYAKGALTDCLVSTIIKKAKEHRVPLAANLKPPRIDPFRGATLLTLNLAEAERAWRHPIGDEADLHRCGQALRKRLACKGLLITRGGDGVVLFSAAGEPLVIPAQRVQVFDVTGAGDTVIGAAAMAIASGATCGEAAAIGNLAGNIKVTKIGAATVDRDEIRTFATKASPETSCHEHSSHHSSRLRTAA